MNEDKTVEPIKRALQEERPDEAVRLLTQVLCEYLDTYGSAWLEDMTSSSDKVLPSDEIEFINIACEEAERLQEKRDEHRE